MTDVDDRLIDWAEEDASHRARYPVSPECDEDRVGEDEHEQCSWQICYCGCHHDIEDEQ